MTFDERIIRVDSSAQGKVLSEWLRENGHMILLPCGGRGVCGKCRVKVIDGVFLNVADRAPATPDSDGCVKSCQVLCGAGEAHIKLPLHEATGLSVEHESEKITTENCGADNNKHYSAALDIGTTTLAMALVELESGKVVASETCLNPQHSYGADVISRISACASGYLNEMRDCVLKAVRSLLNSLLSGKSTTAETMIVVGNTTMLHIFSGVSPESMGAYPFKPSFTDMREFSGDDIDLSAKKVVLLPSVSAFIGADIVSGMLVAQMNLSNKPSLLVDIGTNGEMVLWSGKEFVCASAAAGPALEGGNISCGTGGIPGAISRVYQKENTICYKTINDKAPSGICGCGLVDLIALLLDMGELDETGCLDDDTYRLEAVHEIEALDVSSLTPADTQVELTQKDIREFQLAKSAIRAGIEALACEADVSLNDIFKIYIAGGMGYYMDPAKAARIGMIPEEFIDKVQVCGNTALAGAVRCVIDPALLTKASEYASQCKTLELNSSHVFSDSFIENMMFPE
ncbi:MAG: hypothetical protein DBX61_06795 [Clostridiales bacterium]|nr:MAG: hypothetical protein DBX61_06795 [Clostridiales bacterium]